MLSLSISVTYSYFEVGLFLWILSNFTVIDVSVIDAHADIKRGLLCQTEQNRAKPYKTKQKNVTKPLDTARG